MKTICLLLDHKDANWITEYLQTRSDIEDITVIAPTFEGRLMAESLNLRYKTYEEEAWSIDKNRLFDKARIQAHRWHQLIAIRQYASLEAFRWFKDYPLLEMHQSLIFLALYEILQAYEFMTRIFELEHPDKLVIGGRENPFNKDRLFILTGSDGVEREAGKVLANQQGIELVEIDIQPAAESVMKSSLLTKLVRGIRDTRLVAKKIASYRYLFEMFASDQNENSTESKDHAWRKPKFIWGSQFTGPKILLFVWGGHYFHQLLGAIDLLIQKKARIVLVLIGGRLTENEVKTLHEKNIHFFTKSDWPVEKCEDILCEWKEKGLEAYQNIIRDKALRDYFTNHTGSYFPSLVESAIRRELVRNMPKTVVELIRSESIITAFDPDLVFTHFSLHPPASCDVLPARVRGIPTLTLTHGVNGLTNSVRYTFSTEYHAVSGQVYKSALTKALNCPEEVVIPVGSPRLEKIENQMSVQVARRALGYREDNPLCIFCDNSGWAQALEWRHSTWRTIQEIINLKKSFPDLQIIYRVHHGSDYTQMEKYFEDLDIPDITFQIASDIALTDIAQAANLVISHHTSAVTEALVSGVRVIYLCALSDIEPSYLNCEAIEVARDFKSLPELVRSILDNPMSKEGVRILAKSYFDRTLCGYNGNAANRLAQLILNLARIPKSERKYGFQDWLDRIEASCDFKFGDWNTDMIYDASKNP